MPVPGTPGGRHGNDFDVPEAQMIQGLVISLGTERRVYLVTPGRRPNFRIFTTVGRDG
ncbi:MAG: hypothetical protein Q7R45_15685 [Sulfuricaulis sp.]|nr:hypothetical protein [Sulfuricaulis sp.]